MAQQTPIAPIQLSGINEINSLIRDSAFISNAGVFSSSKPTKFISSAKNGFDPINTTHDDLALTFAKDFAKTANLIGYTKKESGDEFIKIILRKHKAYQASPKTKRNVPNHARLVENSSKISSVIHSGQDAFSLYTLDYETIGGITDKKTRDIFGLTEVAVWNYEAVEDNGVLKYSINNAQSYNAFIGLNETQTNKAKTIVSDILEKYRKQGKNARLTEQERVTLHELIKYGHVADDDISMHEYNGISIPSLTRKISDDDVQDFIDKNTPEEIVRKAMLGADRLHGVYDEKVYQTTQSYLRNVSERVNANNYNYIAGNNILGFDNPVTKMITSDGQFGEGFGFSDRKTIDVTRLNMAASNRQYMKGQSTLSNILRQLVDIDPEKNPDMYARFAPLKTQMASMLGLSTDASMQEIYKRFVSEGAHTAQMDAFATLLEVFGKTSRGSKTMFEANIERAAQNAMDQIDIVTGSTYFYNPALNPNSNRLMTLKHIEGTDMIFSREGAVFRDGKIDNRHSGMRWMDNSSIIPSSQPFTVDGIYDINPDDVNTPELIQLLSSNNYFAGPDPLRVMDISYKDGNGATISKRIFGTKTDMDDFVGAFSIDGEANPVEMLESHRLDAVRRIIQDTGSARSLKLSRALYGKDSAGMIPFEDRYRYIMSGTSKEEISGRLAASIANGEIVGSIDQIGDALRILDEQRITEEMYSHASYLRTIGYDKMLKPFYNVAENAGGNDDYKTYLLKTMYDSAYGIKEDGTTIRLFDEIADPSAKRNFVIGEEAIKQAGFAHPKYSTFRIGLDNEYGAISLMANIQSYAGVKPLGVRPTKRQTERYYSDSYTALAKIINASINQIRDSDPESAKALRATLKKYGYYGKGGKLLSKDAKVYHHVAELTGLSDDAIDSQEMIENVAADFFNVLNKGNYVGDTGKITTINNILSPDVKAVSVLGKKMSADDFIKDLYGQIEDRVKQIPYINIMKAIDPSSSDTSIKSFKSALHNVTGGGHTKDSYSELLKGIGISERSRKYKTRAFSEVQGTLDRFYMDAIRAADVLGLKWEVAPNGIYVGAQGAEGGMQLLQMPTLYTHHSGQIDIRYGKQPQNVRFDLRIDRNGMPTVMTNLERSLFDDHYQFGKTDRQTGSYAMGSLEMRARRMIKRGDHVDAYTLEKMVRSTLSSFVSEHTGAFIESAHLASQSGASTYFDLLTKDHNVIKQYFDAGYFDRLETSERETYNLFKGIAQKPDDFVDIAKLNNVFAVKFGAIQESMMSHIDYLMNNASTQEERDNLAFSRQMISEMSMANTAEGELFKSRIQLGDYGDTLHAVDNPVRIISHQVTKNYKNDSVKAIAAGFSPDSLSEVLMDENTYALSQINKELGIHNSIRTNIYLTGSKELVERLTEYTAYIDAMLADPDHTYNKTGHGRELKYMAHKIIAHAPQNDGSIASVRIASGLSIPQGITQEIKNVNAYPIIAMENGIVSVRMPESRTRRMGETIRYDHPRSKDTVEISTDVIRAKRDSIESTDFYHDGTKISKDSAIKSIQRAINDLGLQPDHNGQFSKEQQAQIYQYIKQNANLQVKTMLTPIGAESLKLSLGYEEKTNAQIIGFTPRDIIDQNFDGAKDVKDILEIADGKQQLFYDKILTVDDIRYLAHQATLNGYSGTETDAIDKLQKALIHNVAKTYSEVISGSALGDSVDIIANPNMIKHKDTRDVTTAVVNMIHDTIYNDTSLSIEEKHKQFQNAMERVYGAGAVKVNESGKAILQREQFTGINLKELSKLQQEYHINPKHVMNLSVGSMVSWIPNTGTGLIDAETRALRDKFEKGKINTGDFIREANAIINDEGVKFDNRTLRNAVNMAWDDSVVDRIIQEGGKQQLIDAGIIDVNGNLIKKGAVLSTFEKNVRESMLYGTHADRLGVLASKHGLANITPEELGDFAHLHSYFTDPNKQVKLAENMIGTTAEDMINNIDLQHLEYRDAQMSHQETRKFNLNIGNSNYTYTNLKDNIHDADELKFGADSIGKYRDYFVPTEDYSITRNSVLDLGEDFGDRRYVAVARPMMQKFEGKQTTSEYLYTANRIANSTDNYYSIQQIRKNLEAGIIDIEEARSRLSEEYNFNSSHINTDGFLLDLDEFMAKKRSDILNDIDTIIDQQHKYYLDKEGLYNRTAVTRLNHSAAAHSQTLDLTLHNGNFAADSVMYGKTLNGKLVSEHIKNEKFYDMAAVNKSTAKRMGLYNEDMMENIKKNFEDTHHADRDNPIYSGIFEKISSGASNEEIVDAILDQEGVDVGILRYPVNYDSSTRSVRLYTSNKIAGDFAQIAAHTQIGMKNDNDTDMVYLYEHLGNDSNRYETFKKLQQEREFNMMANLRQNASHNMKALDLDQTYIEDTGSISRILHDDPLNFFGIRHVNALDSTDIPLLKKQLINDEEALTTLHEEAKSLIESIGAKAKISGTFGKDFQNRLSENLATEAILVQRSGIRNAEEYMLDILENGYSKSVDRSDLKPAEQHLASQYIKKKQLNVLETANYQRMQKSNIGYVDSRLLTISDTITYNLAGYRNNIPSGYTQDTIDASARFQKRIFGYLNEEAINAKNIESINGGMAEYIDSMNAVLFTKNNDREASLNKAWGVLSNQYRSTTLNVLETILNEDAAFKARYDERLKAVEDITDTTASDLLLQMGRELFDPIKEFNIETSEHYRQSRKWGATTFVKGTPISSGNSYSSIYDTIESAYQFDNVEDAEAIADDAFKRINFDAEEILDGQSKTRASKSFHQQAGDIAKKGLGLLDSVSKRGLAIGALGLAGTIMVSSFVGGNPSRSPQEDAQQYLYNQSAVPQEQPIDYGNASYNTPQQGYVINMKARSPYSNQQSLNRSINAVSSVYGGPTSINIRVNNTTSYSDRESNDIYIENLLNSLL